MLEKNNKDTPMPTVSIIIPVYNAADTLPILLESIYGQGYIRLEVIFVNDNSRDGSLALLNSSKERLEKLGVKVKIIDHQVNCGVASARNSGLDNATGEYIYFVDADDIIEPTAIEELVGEALRTNSDIVGSDWFLSFKRTERRMRQSTFATPWEAIQKMLEGSMRWNLWLFLVRRSLYEENKIRFIPSKNMGEDLLIMIKLFASSKGVSHIKLPLYHYRQTNEHSLTKTYSAKHIEEVITNVNQVEEFLESGKYREQLGNLLHYLKLNIKLPLLISNVQTNFRLWLRWYSEANHFVLENKALSRRIRWLQLAAVKRQFWIVRLHYYLVVKVVYGVIYK